MANDQQTYKRAANAALIGLAAQTILAVGMALIGLYAQSPAIYAATWHFFGGLPIWIILWVLFHQHQLERVEALEAEQMSRDARSAALFDEAGQQLQIARGRLESLNKWWLPIVSVGVATYLLAVGGTLLYRAWQAQQAGTLRGAALNEAATDNLGVVFTVLLVIGFLAFLVARYVAGMTRLPEWTLLRGGASYLMGGVVVAALLVAGTATVWFGNLGFFAWLALIIPGLMVLLGVEILLGFVLGLYRPRRPGEISRPAFDARSLGWLTRPESLGKILNETINYQFGFEISRSWFYRLVSKAVIPLILIGFAVLIGLTSIVIVAPQQQAVIIHLGAFKRVVTEPGLTWKWPWPIDTVEKYDVYRVHEVAIGSEPETLRPGVPVLWTNQHATAGEDYMLVAPTQFLDESEALISERAAAGELVGARVVVKYRVADLEDYVKSARDPSAVLARLAARRVNTYFVTHDIDTLLTDGRISGGSELREGIQADLDAFDPPLGIEVVFVGFETIHPPQEGEVAAAFHDQIDARQQQASAIEDARKEAITILAEVAGSQNRALQINEAIATLDRIRQQIAAASESEQAALREQEMQQEVEIERLLDQAGGRAAQLIYDARAYRWSHALTERARAMAVRSQYESYRQAPDYFMKRMYLQTVSDALQDRRTFVIAGDPEGTRDIRLELQQEGVNLGGLFDN